VGCDLTITDDRGDEHPVVRIEPRRLPADKARRRSFRLERPEDHESDLEAAFRIGGRVRQWEHTNWSAVRVITLSLRQVSWLGLIAVAATTWANLGAGGAALVFAAMLCWIGFSLTLGRAKALRERGRLASLPPVCLACITDLTGVGPDTDGCTTCPECGAAWRLARDAPPASPAPPDGNPAAHGPDPR